MHYAMIRGNTIIIRKLLCSGGSVVTLLDEYQQAPIDDALTLGNVGAIAIVMLESHISFSEKIEKKYPVINKVKEKITLMPLILSIPVFPVRSPILLKLFPK
jgi:hypothetical protein